MSTIYLLLYDHYEDQPMNETTRILCAISEAESITYLNLTKKARSHPSQVMAIMETFEEQGLVTVDRSQPPARIRLTPLGAERAREAMEGMRSS